MSEDNIRSMENIAEEWRQFDKYIKSKDPKDPRILYIWQTVWTLKHIFFMLRIMYEAAGLYILYIPFLWILYIHIGGVFDVPAAAPLIRWRRLWCHKIGNYLYLYRVWSPDQNFLFAKKFQDFKKKVLWLCSWLLFARNR